MLSRISSPIVSLYFWAAQLKPTHFLETNKLIYEIFSGDFIDSSSNIDHIEKTFKKASDDVLYDETSKKYYINRNAGTCYSSSMWDDFFDELKGLAVNRDGRGNWTLLGVAAYKNDLTLATWLIETQGADVNYNRFIRVPLVAAASQGHIEFMKYLLAKGADINKPCDYSHGTALHLAVRRGRVEVVDFLIQQHALLLENRYHVTAIELAERIIEALDNNVSENKDIKHDKHISLREYDPYGNEIPLPSLEIMNKILEKLKTAYENKASMGLKM